MGSVNLPAEFLDEMKKLLGNEFPEFLSSYDLPRENGLRLNRRRVSPEEFERQAPFALRPIPWTDNGYYVDWRRMPARHPYYNAGVYYLQEPSAMAPAQILAPQRGDRVLDLCAAPGGKATELGARLSACDGAGRGMAGPEGREGLLVANEISAQRARALLRNLELFGIPNALVTNETPARLAERFPCFFDRILVDAPCSGEGMFRKDPDVVRAWYPDKVSECAGVQREIILQASDMLRPGGYMVYSTCTFSVQENELVLLHLLKNREQMELVEIQRTEGKESFSPAFSVRALRELGYTEEEEDLCLERAVRIWPHKAGGEGHFMALLRKREDTSPALLPDPAFVGRSREKKKKAGRKGGQAQGRSGSLRLTKEEESCLRTFLERFLPPGAEIDTDRLENHNGKVYLPPEGMEGMRGLTFLRSGLFLGELKKNRFEPSQQFAMALPAGAEGEERISFSPGDERTAQYLRGETVRTEGGRENGWYLVCVDGYPLGWGKLAGGILKNKLLQSWRI